MQHFILGEWYLIFLTGVYYKMIGLHKKFSPKFSGLIISFRQLYYFSLFLPPVNSNQITAFINRVGCSQNYQLSNLPVGRQVIN